MVFYGEYSVSFTAPGRIVLPKKLRALLQGNSFIVSKGFGTCLAGYDKEDWESRAQSLLQVSLLDETDIAKRRFVFSSATVVEIDEQGRFVIPKVLMEYAELGGKVVIAGVGDHFEVWDHEAWVNQLKAN